MINSNSVLTLARGLFISDVEAYMLGGIFIGYSYSGEFLGVQFLQIGDL